MVSSMLNKVKFFVEFALKEEDYNQKFIKYINILPIVIKRQFFTQRTQSFS